MTPTPSSRIRGAVGAAVLAAGILLTGIPSAVAAPTTDAVSTINDRYTAFGGQGSLLGAPTGDAVDVPGGAERDYEGGAIYYSKDTGAHVMYGAILDRYRDLGGPASELGFPKNDESDTGDGTGRFNDFTTPGGASIYWTPQWGASVVKGRVLEAWRQSGGITGPFGYPSADTSIVDGVQTGKFAGPDGSEIQWSETGGLVTVPTELAGTLPGFGAAPPPPPPVATTAEGTTSVSTPEPAAPEKSTKGNKWWWIPLGLLVAALAGLAVKLLRRRPEPEPVRVARAPEVRKPAPVTKTVPPRPAPVKAPPAPPVVKTPPPAPRAVVPPAPPKPATPTAPTPPRVAPRTHVPPPPPAPKPFVPPAPRPVVETPKPVIPEPPKVVRPVVVPEPPKVVRPVVVPDLPKVVHVEPVHTEPVHVEPARVVHTEPVIHAETVIHTEPVIHTESVVHHATSVEHDVSPVIRYESSTPTETTIQVTYENNAVGDHQESRADKSDATPD